MNRLWKRILVLFVIALIIPSLAVAQGPDEDEGQENEPDTENVQHQWEMLDNLARRTLLPLQEQFLTAAADLKAAAYALRETPSLTTLEALQATWRTTATAWVRADLIGLDQSAAFRNQILKTPANIKFIEGFIAKEERIDAAFIASIGSTAKGLFALEYLLFDTESDNAAILAALTTGERAAQRMQYVVACAEALYSVGEDYTAQWRAEATRYAGVADNPTQLKHITIMYMRMTTNKFIDALQSVLADNLGQPLGRTTGGTPRPDLVESRRAHFSTQLIIARLEGLHMIFGGLAVDKTSFTSYADLLDEVKATYEDSNLSTLINAHLEGSLAALRALDKPLEVAVVEQTEQVGVIYESVRTAARLIKADMTSKLGVSLTFSDNDGD